MAAIISRDILSRGIWRTLKRDSIPLRSYFSKSKIKVSEDLLRAEVKLPGLAVGDVERSGNFANALQITRLVEAATVMPYFPKGHNIPSFGDMWSFEEEYFDFTKCAWHFAKPQFYTSPIHTSEMTVKMEIFYIGKTSFQFRVVVVEEDEELLESRTSLVCVNKATHQPSPLPEWWVKQFKPIIPSHHKPHLVQSFQKPEGVKVHSYDMKCAYSDTDLFGHVNNANYPRYCLEAASDAARKGLFSKISKNLYFCHMKEIEQLYIGQCLSGDHIIVETWENPNDPYTLHFVINNKTELAYQCTLKLYE